MSRDDAYRSDPSGAQSASFSGCAVRLLWLLFGPAAFAVGIALLIGSPQPLASTGHLLLLGAALVMIVVRYLDVAHFSGLDSSGKPSTMHQVRRFAISVLGITALASGLALWLGA